MFITHYFYWFFLLGLFSSCSFFSQEEPQGIVRNIAPCGWVKDWFSSFSKYISSPWGKKRDLLLLLVASGRTLGIFILFSLLFSFKGAKWYVERERLGNTHFVSTSSCSFPLRLNPRISGTYFMCLGLADVHPYNQSVHFRDFFTTKISCGRET